jgi:tRNA pseudouridine32 synthase/23S rRNA pseudouridine746 synthase
VAMVDICIIDHQDDFLVVDKPADINFHDEEVVGSGFHSQVKKFAREQLDIENIYPVHRLDKMTSGLMLFAKNINTTRAFQLLFEQHKVQKFYLAIADGKPKKKQGLIKGDMEKSRRGMWKLMRTMDNPAISQFQSYNVAPKRRLYLIKPHSGKTHQIRVALNSIGVPILGDPLYNTNVGSDRGYLHAFALAFTLNDQHYQYCHAPNFGVEFINASTTSAIVNLTPIWQQSWPKI